MARALKICYVSWHSILEADELRIFGELGHKYLSLGAYYNPYDTSPRPRPQLPAEYSLYDELKGDYSQPLILTKEQVEPFDILIFMHEPSYSQPLIWNNWENIKHKKVIYRSIGQSSRLVEKSLKEMKEKGLLVVRYSPREEKIPWYCGSDALIRFYKDENEFANWNGRDLRVATIAQSMKDRETACNYKAFLQATEPFERRLYGFGNGNTGLIGGALEYEELKQVYRNNRVYFYTGTQPASYALNFIEAFMTGIPIVALGPKHCNRDYPEQETYEVHEIIKDGVNGFWSDNIEELRARIKSLLESEELARTIGQAGRETAIKLFGKEKIKNDWKIFLEKIMEESCEPESSPPPMG
jgi:hypothetical protein